ncbi:autotransporter outer membrane beta-barrel domain-containing protein [Variovorax sp. J2P1-59]|uniref:autotransporter family protein n=1 Tax=Variovorax flavidus TaxID=3053501 RepID=UPI002577155F|nr:autotransporter outer membrane beta-barrel domain-containing protein [Variovorax sp. J2P1-59]MDM0074462.1 autotransporter outer membrane beta-barrel domain-containing protein [Variovorax sp. J2P1-59]
MAVVALCASSFGAFAQCTPSPVGTTSLCSSEASIAALARPQTGAYMGNQRLSSFAFVHSLQDRGDLLQEGSGNVWLRGGGQGMSSTSAGGRIDTDSRTWMLQGGGDVAKWSLFGGADRLHLGAMAGYASGRTDSNALGNPIQARGDTSGGGFGVYGTWYQNDRTRLGWYADVWGQYARFNNTVDTPLIFDRTSYNSHVGMFSVEGGYALRLGEASNWVLEPQGQVIYLHNHSYVAIEPSGLIVEGSHRGSYTSRLGLRLRSASTPDSGWRIRPYAAVNWWYDNTGEELVINQFSVRDMYPSNRYELKAGVNVDFRQGWAGYGDLGWQWGSQSYQAWTVRGGMKYAW